ncbi:MAG: M20/M25/M40 family metallo-hydrolase [Candidatus Micrarchaeota archaeon]
MSNKSSVALLALELMKIKSENPPGNEADIAEFIKNYLLQIGAKVKLFEPSKNRVSVLGAIGQGKQLFYCSHSDTVQALGTSTPQINSDLLIGRGSVDDKGPLAAVLAAAKQLVDSDVELNGQLLIGALADEEEGSVHGAKKLLKQAKDFDLRPAASVVTEATDFNVETGELGVLRFKAYCKGKAVHASRPENGINAIYLMNDFVQEFRKLKFEPLSGFPPTTFNVGVIKGGSKQSIVPDYCDADVDVRLNPAQSKETILADLLNIEKQLNTKNTNFNLSVNVYRYDAPHKLIGETYFAELLQETVKQNGKSGNFIIESGVTIAKFLNLASFPAIVFGPGKSGLCHSSQESIAVQDLELAREIYKNYALNFLGVKNAKS